MARITIVGDNTDFEQMGMKVGPWFEKISRGLVEFEIEEAPVPDEEPHTKITIHPDPAPAQPVVITLQVDGDDYIAGWVHGKLHDPDRGISVLDDPQSSSVKIQVEVRTDLLRDLPVTELNKNLDNFGTYFPGLMAVDAALLKLASAGVKMDLTVQYREELLFSTIHSAIWTSGVFARLSTAVQRKFLELKGRARLADFLVKIHIVK